MTFEVTDDNDGFGAFLTQLDPEAAASELPKKEPEDGQEAATVETSAEAPEGGSEDGQEAPDANSEAPTDGEDEDEREVTWKAGETETKVKLRDLKAAFVERQATSQQAQQVTQAREAAAQMHQKADTALREMLKRAEAAFEPYKGLNLLALAKNPDIDGTMLQQIQNDAAAALANVQYLRTELDANLQAAQQNSQAAQREATLACVKVLMDPKTGIEGFNKQVWEDIAGFAVKEGVPAQVVNNLTDPAAIKLIHKAMLFDKQKAAAASAAEKVKVVKAQPQRTMKAANTTDPKTATAGKRDAMRALRSTGSVDDAADAFAASFE